MSQEKKKGLLNLAKKSLSVIAASLAALTNNEVHATTNFGTVEGSENHNINIESINKRVLKPKLVLKLNMANPDNSILAMHTSHRSHSSHSSHSSHYSSAPTYTPSRPVYTPPTSSGSSSSSSSSYPSSSGSSLSSGYSSSSAYDVNGERILYKGCQGDDVTKVQQLLKAKGYVNVPISGYFGEETEAAVKKFQKAKDLPIDGKVGALVRTYLNK